MIKDLLRDGFFLKQNGHYKQAIEIFYKALEEDNSSTELLLEIAESYYHMQNEERALTYIEQILNKEPEHVEALKLLRKIFVDKKAFAEAEQTAKNIYCISRDINDLAEIFRLLNLQGKYDEIFEYNISLRNAQIYLEQARALFLKKEFVKSRDLLESALGIYPENENLILLLCKVCYSMGQKDLSLKLITKVPSTYDDAELLNLRGLLEDYQGNSKAACKYIYNAIKQDMNNDKYYFNLANIYFKQGDFMYAKKYYNLAISLNPENKNYHFALANLYYSDKHYKKALEELPEGIFEADLLKMIILYETGYYALAHRLAEELRIKHADNKILQEYSGRIDNELKVS